MVEQKFLTFYLLPADTLSHVLSFYFTEENLRYPYKIMSQTYLCLRTSMLLGMFTKLQRAIISFIMSVCLHEEPNSNQTDFHKKGYLRF
jgi:hypothetical protein